MSLTDTLSALPPELRSRAHHRELFASAQARHSVLAEYGDIEALIELLTAGSDRSYSHGESLARALIMEQQARPSPTWTALLLLLCAPMLGRLRSSVQGTAVEADDLGQTIVTRFLEVTQGLSLPDTKEGHTFAALRSKTRRAVFREVKLEQGQPAPFDPNDLFELIEGEEACAAGVLMAPSTQELTPKERRQQVQKQTVLLKHLLGDELNDEQLMLIVHTQVLGQSLTGFVAEHYAQLSPDERTRAYERLKRQHGRSVQTIRRALAHLRHPRAAKAVEDTADLDHCG